MTAGTVLVRIRNGNIMRVRVGSAVYETYKNAIVNENMTDAQISEHNNKNSQTISQQNSDYWNGVPTQNGNINTGYSTTDPATGGSNVGYANTQPVNPNYTPQYSGNTAQQDYSQQYQQQAQPDYQGWAQQNGYIDQNTLQQYLQQQQQSYQQQMQQLQQGFGQQFQDYQNQSNQQTSNLQNLLNQQKSQFESQFTNAQQQYQSQIGSLQGQFDKQQSDWLNQKMTLEQQMKKTQEDSNYKLNQLTNKNGQNGGMGQQDQIHQSNANTNTEGYKDNQNITNQTFNNYLNKITKGGF